jgi:two-component sensor histidine kinase
MAEEQASLHGVLEEIFAPYGGRERLALSGDNPAIDDRSATPLALLFHELATNAAKYGALSTATGHVALHVADDGEDVRLDWREEGGPVVAPVASEGFGSRLIALSVERQLGGRLEREWHPEGARLSLWIPRRSLHRVAAGRA